MKHSGNIKLSLALLIAVLLSLPASAGDLGEWGDAPENGLAYPSIGVMGAFPTCQNSGPAAWVWHGPLCWAFFGPGCDFEPEGHAGFCAAWPPYDMDECFADNDAGLLFPGAYTIAGGAVVPCADAGQPLFTCTTASWGGQIDIHVTNNMPVDGYVNVLFDWDLSGTWGGIAPCPNAGAPEHVLVNFVVPMGFSGPLSALGPPPFLVGPRNGFVWARFSVSETPVPQDWDGAQIFEDGESEDYLIRLDDGVAVEQTSISTVKSLYR